MLVIDSSKAEYKGQVQFTIAMNILVMLLLFGHWLIIQQEWGGTQNKNDHRHEKDKEEQEDGDDYLSGFLANFFWRFSDLQRFCAAAKR